MSIFGMPSTGRYLRAHEWSEFSGLGQLPGSRESICISVCDAAFAGSMTGRDTKCIQACTGATGVGLCQPRCASAGYWGSGAQGRRAKCTTACQSSFSPAMAQTFVESATAPPPGREPPAPPTQAGIMSGPVIPILIIAGVAGGAYWWFFKRKGSGAPRQNRRRRR